MTCSISKATQLQQQQSMGNMINGYCLGKLNSNFKKGTDRKWSMYWSFSLNSILFFKPPNASVLVLQLQSCFRSWSCILDLGLGFAVTITLFWSLALFIITNYVTEISFWALCRLQLLNNNFSPVKYYHILYISTGALYLHSMII